jgi:hypothetical protein
MSDARASDAALKACLKVRARKRRKAEDTHNGPLREKYLRSTVLACADLSKAWNPRHELPIGVAPYLSDRDLVEQEFRGDGDPSSPRWNDVNLHVSDRYAFVLWSPAAEAIRDNQLGGIVVRAKPVDKLDQRVHPLFCRLVRAKEPIELRRVGPVVSRQLAALRAKLQRLAPDDPGARYEIGGYFDGWLLRLLDGALEQRRRARVESAPQPDPAPALHASAATYSPSKPLSRGAQAIARVLCALPPADALPAPKIVLAVHRLQLQPPYLVHLDEHAVRDRYFEELKPWGMQNRRGLGYFIPEDRRSALMQFIRMSGASGPQQGHDQTTTKR